ncbi:unnamed protein product, partial [Phaeothamnion confervicola]
MGWGWAEGTSGSPRHWWHRQPAVSAGSRRDASAARAAAGRGGPAGVAAAAPSAPGERVADAVPAADGRTEECGSGSSGDGAGARKRDGAAEDDQVASSDDGDAGPAFIAMGNDSDGRDDSDADDDAGSTASDGGDASRRLDGGTEVGRTGGSSSSGSGSADGGSGGGSCGGDGGGGGGGISRDAAARSKLSHRELAVLERHINAHPGDVDGWLLLAAHQLPAASSNAAAAAIGEEAARPAAAAATTAVPAPVVNEDLLKPALRTLSLALEHEGNRASEALWVAYLSLLCASGGAGAGRKASLLSHALRGLPLSLCLWRLARALRPTSQLLDVLADLGRQWDAAAAAVDALSSGSAARAAQQDDDAAAGGGDGGGGDGKNRSNRADGGSTGSDGGSADGGAADSAPGGFGVDDGMTMLVHLVLERAQTLALAGVPEQAAEELLAALQGGGTNTTINEDSDRALGITKVVVVAGAAAGKAMEVEPEEGEVVAAAAAAASNAPAFSDSAVRLARAPRRQRLLLWHAHLHLLAFGAFPAAIWPLLGSSAWCRGGGGGGGGVGGGRDSPRAEEGARVARSEAVVATKLLRWPINLFARYGPAAKRLEAQSTQEKLRVAFRGAGMEAGVSEAAWDAAFAFDRFAAPPLLAFLAELETKAAAGGTSVASPAPVAAAATGVSSAASGSDAGAANHIRADAALAPFLLNWALFEKCIGDVCAQSPVRRGGLLLLGRYDSRLLQLELLHAMDAARNSSGGGGYGSADDTGPGEKVMQTLSGRRQLLEVLRPALRRRDCGALLCMVTACGNVPSESAAAAGTKTVAVAATGSAVASAPFAALAELLREALIEFWLQGRGASGVHSAADWSWRVEEEARRAVATWGRSSPQQRCPKGSSASVGMEAATGGEAETAAVFATVLRCSGATAACDLFDHVLSAESFAGLTPERRRSLWLQRLDAAIAVATAASAGGADTCVGGSSSGDGSSGGAASGPGVAAREAAVREAHRAVQDIVLGALRDKGSASPGGSETVSSWLADALVAAHDEKHGSVDVTVTSAATDAFYAHLLYRYGAFCGGVDWVVDATAASAATAVTAPGTATAQPAAGKPAAADAAAADIAAARRDTRHLLPLLTGAASRQPGNAAVAAAAAACAAAAGAQAQAQRVLEAAAAKQPLCAALWERLAAFEARHGGGDSERAGQLAAAAASWGITLSLR